MDPKRWHVRSLRRFRDEEIFLYLYLLIGGAFSAIYFVSAVMHTKLYTLLFDPSAWGTHSAFLNGFVHIIMLSILRAVLWLPQFFWQVVMGGAAWLDWLTAANIVRELT